MKYKHQPNVLPEVAEKSQREISAVNEWMDNLQGTVIAIQRIRSGQARPYADSVDEALICCHQPNVFTTGGPILRCISKEDAATIAKIFIGKWVDEPQFLERRLVSLEPAPNPWGMEESNKERGLYSTWRIILREPYND